MPAQVPPASICMRNRIRNTASVAAQNWISSGPIHFAPCQADRSVPIRPVEKAASDEALAPVSSQMVTFQL